MPSVDPSHAPHGGVSYFHFVCAYVRVQNIKSIERINFILVEAFPLTQRGNHGP